MIDGYHVCLARLDEKLIAQWKKKVATALPYFEIGWSGTDGP